MLKTYIEIALYGLNRLYSEISMYQVMQQLVKKKKTKNTETINLEGAGGGYMGGFGRIKGWGEML